MHTMQLIFTPVILGVITGYEALAELNLKLSKLQASLDYHPCMLSNIKLDLKVMFGAELLSPIKQTILAYFNMEPIMMLGVQQCWVRKFEATVQCTFLRRPSIIRPVR